jgi:hypothetical protein
MACVVHVCAELWCASSERATEKMAKENPMSQGRESAMEKDIRDAPRAGPGVENPNKQNPRDNDVKSGVQ